MKTFINTFSIQILLTKEEHASLLASGDKLFTYNKNKTVWEMRRFENCGLQAEIESINLYTRQANDTVKDPWYELRFVVTLAKLLDPNRNLGGLTKRNEIEDACTKLSEIIRDLEKYSGVNLLQKAELYQVDLAKDVMTPNEFYSLEIIEAANNALDIEKYQKHNWISNDLWYNEGGAGIMAFTCGDISGNLY